MKSSGLALVLLAARVWQLALPGYHYEFPKDHFSHPDYKTEWWYYTGNVSADDGRRFGFELTFFRAGLDTDENSTPVWRPNEVWLAHLALSDVKGHKFFHTERINRSGPGLAGAALQDARYWNGNWEVRWLRPDGLQQLQAICDDFSLRLRLEPAKPPVIQGVNGVDQKGPQAGAASHYISFTRLRASGVLNYAGQQFKVTGLSWMDHEFFSEQQQNNFSGWDWFAIQLNNDEELMLYRLRLKSGGESPYSSGTYIDRQGHAEHLSANDFTLQPGETWHSKQSGANYPLDWTISVPKLDLHLRATTPLKTQELFTPDAFTPTYWEGAVDYSGALRGRQVSGVGYLELTGYAGHVWTGANQ